MSASGRVSSQKTSSNLSNHQFRELRDAFDIFDRDKSGAISLGELKQVLIALNFKVNNNLLKKLMKEMDTDGSGSVEFDEFVKVMGDVYSRQFTDEEMRRAFDCFDTDRSGFITISELREVLHQLNQNISDQRLIEVVRNIDTNHDGKISYEEFVHLLEQS